MKISLQYYFKDVFSTHMYHVLVDGKRTNIKVSRSWVGREHELRQSALEEGLVSIDCIGRPDIDWKRFKSIDSVKEFLKKYLERQQFPETTLSLF